MELKEVAYKSTEIGLIPKDWLVVELGSIGNFKNGINKDKHSFGFGSPFINLMDVFGVPVLSGNEEFDLVNSSKPEQELYNLKQGDVLFVRSSVKPTGVGLTCLIPFDIPNTVFSGFLIRYRDNGKLNEEFKRHCFYQENFRNRVIAASTVSANTNINQDSLKRLKLALPPTTEEQQAIATALSDVDTLISKLDKLIAKKKDIKQGAMQRLLKSPTLGGQRLPGFEGEWKEVNMGEVIDLLTGYPFSSSNYQEFGIRLLRGSNIKRGNTNWDESITQYWPEINPDLKKYELKEGDIVIAMDGSLVGRSFAQLSNIDLPALLLQRVARIRSNSVDLNFLKELVCSDLFTRYCDTVKTVTAIPHISPDDIRNYPVSLPPSKEEQKAIATTLADMDKEIETLDTKKSKYLHIKQGMMQELLTGKTRLV